VRTRAPAPHRPPGRARRAFVLVKEKTALAGGKAYAKDHAAELPRHVAAIEVDSGAGRLRGPGAAAGAGAVEIVQAVLRPLSALDAAAVETGGGGAGISPMKAAGVP